MRYYNHIYINDGIMYRHYLFDTSGNPIVAHELYERWKFKRVGARPRIEKVMSFDDGYSVGTIKDIVIAGGKPKVWLVTKSGRKLWVTWDLQLQTRSGPCPVRELSIGEDLVCMDYYKNYYGDQIKLDTSGNGRVRALLRNHGIPFEILPDNSTTVDNMHFVCLDTETSGMKANSGTFTFGLNNYRESLKSILDIPDYVYDPVAKIVDMPNEKKYTIGIAMDEPANFVLYNGLVAQSIKGEINYDKRYTPRVP